VVKEVARCDIEPVPKPMAFDKASVTDFVYISDEPPTAAAANPAGNVTAAQGKADDGVSATKKVAQRHAPAARHAPFAFPPRAGVMQSAEAAARWEAAEHRAKGLAGSRAFHSFLDKAAMVCTSSGPTEAPPDPFGTAKRDSADSNLLTVRNTFVDRACADRIVTAVAFQPGSSEFVAAAYGPLPGHSHGTGEGIVHVWSTRSPELPAFTVECEGDVTSLAFSPRDSQLIYGGTQQGHVVLWDLRVGGDPVAQSFPVAEGHQAPVFAVVAANPSSGAGAAAGAADVLTVSGEGRVCQWQQTLSMPAHSSLLSSADHGMPTAASSPEEDRRSIFMGTADGALLAVTIAADQIDAKELDGRHQAAVTSVDCHPPNANRNLSGLVLTSSLDWGCRLWWAPALGSWRSLDVRGSDAMYDARWCPSNPAVFACGDGSGRVSIFNAGRSVDAAAHSAQVSKVGSPVNRIAWESSGKLLAAGCSNGEVVLCHANAKLAASAAEDAAGLVRRVTA
jgi:dynein intermediate chain